jgi:hypothetical protein
MVGAVLLLTGLVLAGYGGWHGYAAARSAVLPLVREGDPTRSLIEATRPVHARSRVRLVARNVAFAVAWIVIAMYGLLLATTGAAAIP